MSDTAVVPCHVLALVSALTVILLPATAALAQTDGEAAWNRVSDCTDQVDVELFILDYPDSSWVASAEACLAGLSGNDIDLNLNSEIADLLAVCEEHFDANRLLTGAGGTAYACYLDVLARGPGNSEALVGLDRIADKYATWALREVERRNPGKVWTYLDHLKKVNSDDPRIAEIQAAFGKTLLNYFQSVGGNFDAGLQSFIRGSYEAALADARSTLAARETSLADALALLADTRDELETRDGTISGLESRLSEADTALADARAALAAREISLADALSLLAGARDELDEKDSAISGLESRLSEGEVALADARSTLAARETSLANALALHARAREELVLTNRHLAKATSALLALSRDELDAKDSTISGLDSRLSEDDATLANNRSALADRDASLADLRAVLAARESALESAIRHIVQLEAEFQSSLALVSQLSADLEAARAESGETERELADVRKRTGLAADELRRRIEELSRGLSDAEKARIAEAAAAEVLRLRLREFRGCADRHDARARGAAPEG